MCRGGASTRTRTRSPGLNRACAAGSSRPGLLCRRGLLFNSAVDLRTGQDSLLDQQGFERDEPTLVVAQRLVGAGGEALDGPPVLVHVQDASRPEAPEHGIRPLLPHRVLVLGPVDRSGGRRAAAIVNSLHGVLPLPVCQVAALNEPECFSPRACWPGSGPAPSSP